MSGNDSVAIADLGMMTLVKKNAGSFSQRAAIHPKTKPALASEEQRNGKVR